MVFNIALVFTLYYASKEDMKYHRITKKYVSIIFIIVLVYTFLSTQYAIERTFSFLITLCLFTFITFASKGGFGFGDTLILSALALYIGSLMYLRYFFLILVFTMLVWGAYHILKNRKNKKINLKEFFKTTQIVHINNVTPGMILSDDYFMKGLTEKEIKSLKDKGHTTLIVKQAYPFIPVILITFLIYVFFNAYF